MTDDCVTTLGSGVDDRVQRLGVTYDVRGLPSLLSSYDNPAVGAGNVLNQVQFEYNAFGQRITTYQAHDGAVNTMSTPKIQSSYADGAGNTLRPLTFTYPNGREMTYDYGTANGMNDRISRVRAIIDDHDTTLVQYEFLGLGAVVKQTSPEPNLLMTLVSLDGSNDPLTGDIYAGVDRFGRVKDLRWRNTSTDTDLSRVQYGYNRDSNRIWRKNPTDPNSQHDWLYAYDGLKRLQDADRGTLNAGCTAITSPRFAQCWTLDPTENWAGFRQADDGSNWSLIQSRSNNTVNEITDIANTIGSAWAEPAYDPAGNMTTIPKPAAPSSSFTAVYDAWNRLVSIDDGSGIAEDYAYDASSFRLTSTSSANARHFYYSNNWQAVEERMNAGAVPERQFVWGSRYIDDLVCRDRSTERLYSMPDGGWSVCAVIDEFGSVVERYEYTAYGCIEFLTAEFARLSSSAVSWETAYASYRFCSATGLYQVRLRDLAPLLGWLERDPVGVDSATSLYAYCNNSPAAFVDPTGTSAAVAVLPFAAGTALVDGPLPIADILAVGILGGALLYDIIYRPPTPTLPPLAPRMPPRLQPPRLPQGNPNPTPRPNPGPTRTGPDPFPLDRPRCEDDNCDCWCVGYQGSTIGTPTNLGLMSVEECFECSNIQEIPGQIPYEEECACGEGWWELE